MATKRRFCNGKSLNANGKALKGDIKALKNKIKMGMGKC